MRSVSATGMDGNNAETDVNVSMEAPATDVAVVPEVGVLERTFVFDGWCFVYD
jgi:hypothetical protein